MENEDKPEETLNNQPAPAPQVFSPTPAPAPTQNITQPIVTPTPVMGTVDIPQIPAKSRNSLLLKIAAIVMWLLSFAQVGWILFVSALLLSSTGFFNSQQTPWAPAYFYLIGLLVSFYSPWRMWKGHVWNSLCLFITPPLLYATTIAYQNTDGKADITPWLIIAYFVLVWVLLFLRKTRIAFYIFWPLLVFTLLGQIYAGIIEASSQLTIVLLAVAALPAFIFAIIGSRFTSKWRPVTAILLLVFAIPYLIFGSAKHYTSELPTAATAETKNEKQSLKEGVLSEKVVEGVTFKLLQHNHYMDSTLGTTPAPQQFPEGILIPYTQPGADCSDWVAVKPGTTEILWAVYGEVEYCTSPEMIKSSPKDDIVTYTTLREIFIKQISTGKIIYQEELSVDTNPIIDNGIVYFEGMKNRSTGESVYVKAYDAKNKKMVWETKFPDKTYPPSPERGEDFFTLTSEAVLSEVRDIYSTTRRQYLFDKNTGKVTKLDKLSPVKFVPSASNGYFLPTEDMNKNILLAKNAVLAQPIKKLHIGSKEIQLPEPCLSLPVTANDWVYCITEKNVLYFQK